MIGVFFFFFCVVMLLLWRLICQRPIVIFDLSPCNDVMFFCHFVMTLYFC